MCYGFFNPEVNYVVFWMTGYSISKVCINCDFQIAESGSLVSITDCGSRKFVSIKNFLIQNAYFELWIDRSVMNFLIMDVLYFFYFGLTLQFMYYRKHQSRRLLNTPIRKFTRSTNPKCKKKINVQFYIGTVLSLQNIVGSRKKDVGLQEESALLSRLV